MASSERKSYQAAGTGRKILRSSVTAISTGSHAPTSRIAMNRSLSPIRFLSTRIRPRTSSVSQRIEVGGQPGRRERGGDLGLERRAASRRPPPTPGTRRRGRAPTASPWSSARRPVSIAWPTVWPRLSSARCAGQLALVAADDRRLVGDRALDHVAQLAAAAARRPARRPTPRTRRPRCHSSRAVEQRVLPQLAEAGAALARGQGRERRRGRTRRAAAARTRRRGSCRRADRSRSCRRSRRRSSRRASSAAGRPGCRGTASRRRSPARSPTTPPPSATIAEPRSRPRATSSLAQPLVDRERLARLAGLDRRSRSAPRQRGERRREPVPRDVASVITAILLGVAEHAAHELAIERASSTAIG